MTEKKKTGHDDSADLRKRAEEALRESEARYKELWERAPVAYHVLDPDGKIAKVNQTEASILGYQVHEMVGKSIFDFILPEQRDEAQKRFCQKIQGLPIPRIENRIYLKKDGSRIYVVIDDVLERDAHKKITGIRSTMTDITDRKRIEEELLKSEKKYKSLVQTAGSSIATIDQRGIFTFVNETLCRMCGYAEQELIGKQFVGFLHPDDRKNAIQIFENAFINPIGNPYIEFRIIHKDGHIVYMCSNPTAFEYEGQLLGFNAIITDITERKRAEEAVRKSEEKFRSLAENVNLGIYRTTVGPEGKFLEANPAIIEMFGYKSKEEFLAINVSDLYQNPEDRNNFNDKMLKEGSVRGEELRLKKKDGSLLVGSESVVAVKDEQGHVKYYDGIIDNITERKRIEEALQFTRISLDNAADTMAVICRDGRFVDVNKAFCRIVGYSREELLSMTVHDIDPDYQAEMWSGFWERLKQAGSLTFESCHRTKDGRVLPVEIIATFFVHNNQEYHCGFARDITERKRAEEALLKSHEHYSQLANSITDIFFAFDKDLKYTYWNAASEKFLNISAEEAIGKSLYDVFPDTPQTRIAEKKYREVLKTGLSQVFVNEYKIGGKDYYFEISVYPSKEGISVFCKDITERKRAEEVLRKSESQLRALSLELSFIEERERKRLALYLHDEIGQSLALLRMKFGSLTGIWGSKSRKQNIQQIRDLLEEVIDQTHTLTFELSPPVLHQLGLEAAIEWAGEKISQDFGIEFMFSDDGRMKPLDADLLALMFRCVRELMMNIVKHAKARKMTVSLTRREERVFVFVEDDGVGFDMSLPGRQLKRVGFGLFSVRERLSAVGGSYEFQSEPGRGTRITLSVPLKEEMPSS